jgi:hypothetical protein
MWYPPIGLTLEEQNMETIASVPCFIMAFEEHVS